jgi:hypothetical protein
MSSYLARLKSEKRLHDVLPKLPKGQKRLDSVLPKLPKAPFDSKDSNPCRRFQKNDDHPRAWLQDGELRTTGPVNDLAAEVVKLTGDNLDQQRRLLLEHCQAFQPSHIWRLIEQWEERAAILEHDAGLPRHEAEIEAARLYHLTAWLPELQKRITTHA